MWMVVTRRGVGLIVEVGGTYIRSVENLGKALGMEAEGGPD